MEHSKQAAHSSPMKYDPDTNMDKLVISYYNDADLKRHKENYQKKNEDEVAEIHSYLQKTEAGYDPKEYSK